MNQSDLEGERLVEDLIVLKDKFRETTQEINGYRLKVSQDFDDMKKKNADLIAEVESLKAKNRQLEYDYRKLEKTMHDKVRFDRPDYKYKGDRGNYRGHNNSHISTYRRSRSRSKERSRSRDRRRSRSRERIRSRSKDRGHSRPTESRSISTESRPRNGPGNSKRPEDIVRGERTANSTHRTITKESATKEPVVQKVAMADPRLNRNNNAVTKDTNETAVPAIKPPVKIENTPATAVKSETISIDDMDIDWG